MKKLLTISAIILPLFLTACQTTPTVVNNTQTIVISPPESLFNCPQLNRMSLPDPTTLTNRQIADILVKLEKYNRICGINMNQIQAYIERAKDIYQDER